MPSSADTLAELIDAFARLPGIGRKSATRLAYHILDIPPDEVRTFIHAIVDARKLISHCERCGNLSDQPLCRICRDERRANGCICVVEDVRDIVALERSGAYQGRYHVLGGALSPMDGIGPDDLRISSLMERLEPEHIQEVILALNPSIEGEATALYLSERLTQRGITVSRIAQGLPMGADIKYADDLTLARALAARVPIQ